MNEEENFDLDGRPCLCQECMERRGELNGFVEFDPDDDDDELG